MEDKNINLSYKFSEKEGEDKKPVEDRTIEKRGLVVAFSLTGMYADVENFKKTLAEAKGNRDMKQSVVDNVAMHHPMVKDIPEADRYAIHMYQESFASVKAWNEKIAEIEKEYADYLEEIENIKGQIPELKDVVSPYVEKPKEEKSNEEKPSEENKKD